eukprot:scaffold15239_cov120-Skeletonema_dohrnii-CCMP3373.AAC.1
MAQVGYWFARPQSAGGAKVAGGRFSDQPTARARPYNTKIHTKSREHCTYQPSTFWRANCPPGATSRSDPIIRSSCLFLKVVDIMVSNHYLRSVCLLLLTLLSAVVAFSTPRPGAAAASSVSSTAEDNTYLNKEQLEFSIAYLNEHHKTDVLLPFVKAFSDLGTTAIKKNAWIGGSYQIIDASITDITQDELCLEASIKQGEKIKTESVKVHLDSDPVDGMKRTYPTLPPCNPMHLNHASKLPIDNFVRRMNRLCNIVKAYSATGKMIQLGVQMGGKGVGKLNDDMYLNQVPHSKCSTLSID